MTEIIARRQFPPLYIWLDLAFLAVYLFLLLWKKKYMTVLVGAVMGLVYMLVDYGIFHLVCHSRTISEGHSLFWVLLWMSVSYGFTNFTWIWLWISRDSHLFEWSLLILSWWFCCPLLTQTFAGDAPLITIQRTTGAYHGYMAAILFLGYLGLIVYNLYQKDRSKRVQIPWLLAIGILVQLGWEAGLLLGGIRSAGFATLGEKLRPLLINSLLETNLGMPYVYAIYIARPAASPRTSVGVPPFPSPTASPKTTASAPPAPHSDPYRPPPSIAAGGSFCPFSRQKRPHKKPPPAAIIPSRRAAHFPHPGTVLPRTRFYRAAGAESCRTQTVPVTTRVDTPGTTFQVPSAFWTYVAAGTVICPARVAKTPVVSL